MKYKNKRIAKLEPHTRNVFILISSVGVQSHYEFILLTKI